jgi:hypothetical protein
MGAAVMKNVPCEPVELTELELDAVAGGVLNGSFNFFSFNFNGSFDGNNNGNSGVAVGTVNGNGNGNDDGNITIV